MKRNNAARSSITVECTTIDARTFTHRRAGEKQLHMSYIVHMSWQLRFNIYISDPLILFPFLLCPCPAFLISAKCLNIIFIYISGALLFALKYEPVKIIISAE